MRLWLKEKFGDERRTTIAVDASGDFSEEDLISQGNVLISYSAGAYIKRMSADTFKEQHRGGRGIKGMTTRQEDEVINLLFARTLDYILFFTDKGRVYSSKVYELPEASRTARGAHMANFLNMQADERVTTMLVVPDFEDAEYVTLITRKARIKRMELNVFSNVRSTGLIAMNLDDDDSLDWARMTNGNQEFIIVTRNGKALRFHEQNVRSMGRTAAGVKAMRLLGNDEIVSLEVVYPDSDLLVLHERGWGKRTALEEFREKGRHTQGNWATDHRRIDEIGPIVAARVVKPNDQITVMTAHGIVLRTGVSGISRLGRSTRGVRVVNLQDGDSVAALAVLTYEDLTREIDSRDDDTASPVERMAAGTVLSGEDDLHDDILDEADLDGSDLDDSDMNDIDFDDSDFDDGSEAALAIAEEDEQ